MVYKFFIQAYITVVLTVNYLHMCSICKPLGFFLYQSMTSANIFVGHITQCPQIYIKLTQF